MGRKRTMTSSSAGYKMRSRSINWVSAALLTVWVLLVSVAVESLGESKQVVDRGDQGKVVPAAMEDRMDQAICRAYIEARDVLGS
jgi:hypothetical protein